MKSISKDSPLLFLTFDTNHRLPVFRTDTIAEIAASAFDEARKSGGFEIYSCVMMPDHVHMVTGSERTPSDTLRYLKGISARRVIGHLKENEHDRSLAKLKTKNRSGSRSHSHWQHHSNTLFIFSESKLKEKVNYIHLNPVKDGMVDLPGDYRFSSARIWARKPIENEPMEIDLSTIRWSRR